jgi:L-fuconolactonase
MAASISQARGFEVIDGYAHCGLNKYEPIDVLQKVLVTAGISRVVIVQHLGEYDNAYLGSIARENPSTFSCVCLVDHREPDANEQLVHLAESGDFKGVRLTSQVLFERPELATTAAKSELVIQAMPSHSPARWVPILEDVLERYTETLIMLSHMAMPRMDEAPIFETHRPVFDLARYPNVYFQLSFASRLGPYPHEPVYPVITQAVEAFGPERIVWGSNYPPVGGIDEYLADLNLLLDGKLPIPADAIAAVAGINAKRFWFGE